MSFAPGYPEGFAGSEYGQVIADKEVCAVNRKVQLYHQVGKKRKPERDELLGHARSDDDFAYVHFEIPVHRYISATTDYLYVKKKDLGRRGICKRGIDQA